MATFTPSPTLSKLLNIISLGAFFYSNVIYGSFIASPNLAEIANKHPTFFTPANLIVGLFWTVELTLLSGLCYVQYKQEFESIVAEMGYWLTLANTAITIWSYFWLNEEFTLALGVLIIQNFALFRILQNLNQPSIQSVLHSSRGRMVLAKLPLSFYAGWILPDTIYSFFVAYTDTDSVLDLYAATLISAGLGAVGIFMRVGPYKDPWFGAALAFYLFGIAIHQTDHLLIFLSSVLSAAAIAAAPFVVTKLRGGQQPDIERADHVQPLLDEEQA